MRVAPYLTNSHFVMTAFVGRDLAKLTELARLDVPSLVVIKGRRRVGKPFGY
jgi:hypothetical protein